MASYTVEVSRFAGFPVDMLRHDCAWPATSADANLIEALIQANAADISKLARRVRIQLESAQQPTVARWESFTARIVPNGPWNNASEAT